jgi:hypothetical protein
VGVIGFEQLVEAVRRAGAVSQPVIAEAMGADGLEGLDGHRLSDRNVVYSIHTYFEGDLLPQDWARMFGSAARAVPVFVGEWALLPNARYPAMCADLDLTTAAATSLVQRFLAYMDAAGVSYNAWSFTPTHLIVDERSFTPTTLPDPMICSASLRSAGMGALYRNHLLDQAASVGTFAPVSVSCPPQPATGESVVSTGAQGNGRGSLAAIRVR